MIKNTFKLADPAMQLLRERALNDHFFFSKFVLGHNDLSPAVHGPVSRQLEDRSVRERMFILPRGTLKTTHVTTAGAMWDACRDPNVRILIVQNTIGNAQKRLKTIEGHFLNNERFKTLFPDLLPDATCIWNQTQMQVKRPGVFGEATFTASSTRNKQTSNHYDEIYEDDTVSPDLDDMSAENVAPDPADIQQAIGWHRNLTPLYVKAKSGRNIVVGTRWAQLDLLSWIKENQPWYTLYERAAVELNGVADMTGEPIYPELLNRDTITKIHATMGDYLFFANYMNQPMSGDLMPFKPEWIQCYETHPLLSELEIYTTLDLASDNSQTTSKRTDFNVILTAGKDRKTGMVYVLEYWEKKANPSQVINELFEQVKRWNPKRVGIEAVSYQNTLKHWVLKRQVEIHQFFSVEQLHVGNRSKQTKILGLQPVFQAGGVVIRKSMHSLRSQLVAFPYGANDDVVDALAMQLAFWGVTQPAKKPAPVGDGEYRFEDAQKELRTRYTRGGGGALDVLRPRGVAAWN